MRAVLFEDVGRLEVADVPRPAIEDPADAIVAVSTTAVCGSDLHVLSGKTPGMRPGSVIGHEFTGVVEQAGPAVGGLREGARVLGSFLIACGQCAPCVAGRFNYCTRRRALGLGTLNGDLDGAQADYVRIPDADVNLRRLDGALAGLADEQALFAGDILATAFYAAAITGIAPQDRVAVLGAGPVGLLCAAAADRSAAAVVVVDLDAQRASFAERTLGLAAVAPAPDEVASAVAAHAGGPPDVVIEAVGSVPAFHSALKLVAPGGRVTVVGVYGAERYELAMGRAWASGMTVRFAGMANVQGHWDEALAQVASGNVDPTMLITHRMSLDEAEDAYELFSSRRAMKVVMTT